MSALPLSTSWLSAIITATTALIPLRRPTANITPPASALSTSAALAVTASGCHNVFKHLLSDGLEGIRCWRQRRSFTAGARTAGAGEAAGSGQRECKLSGAGSGITRVVGLRWCSRHLLRFLFLNAIAWAHAVMATTQATSAGCRSRTFVTHLRCGCGLPGPRQNCSRSSSCCRALLLSRRALLLCHRCGRCCRWCFRSCSTIAWRRWLRNLQDRCQRVILHRRWHRRPGGSRNLQSRNLQERCQRVMQQGRC
mmetsp:Transcript_64221/g.114013  ORF Transcript_64221/g.114013 Transcript_64221/m.114013 type:complete len:253 (+) Transcript_64221:156-914(+)